MVEKQRSRSPPHRSSSPAWTVQDFTGGGGYTRKGLRRICFQMRFETSELAQYLKDHETVWPEMQQALVDCGWHNYSLYYREDGFAVGYFETDVDFKTACGRMEKHAVNAKWQDAMKRYTPANVSPIDAAGELKHYFYLGTDRQAERDDQELTAPFDKTWKPQRFTGGGGKTAAGLRRVCFQMRFEVAELAQYLKDHEKVWPDMQSALVECGWHNYSLFYRDDGYAVGFFETDVDFKAACERMNGRDVNSKWQAAMSKYTPANLSPVDSAKELTEYFHLGSP